MTRPAIEAEAQGLPDLRTLFRAHGDSVARCLRYAGVADADLEDALQEVFLVAHRRRADFEGGGVASWLRTIAFHVARNARRSRRRRREHPSAEPAAAESVAPAQSEQVERRQLREKLQRLLEVLPESQREVVVLYEIEQLPMKDVAAQLGIPLQTAYSRAKAARLALRRAWEGGAS